MSYTGTGKSFSCTALVNELAGRATCLKVNAAHFKSKWIGESEKKFSELFDYAIKHEPSIIFIG